MTPAEIAARLTPAQRRALLWLPADGRWVSRIHLSLAHGPRSMPGASTAPPLLALLKVGSVEANPTSAVEDWRLTPLGAEVRAILAAQEAERDG